MKETFRIGDGWGLTDSDYEPRLTHGVVAGSDWADVAEVVGLDPNYSPRHDAIHIGHARRVALLETGTVGGAVYVVGDDIGVPCAVVRWTDYVTGEWAEAYTGADCVAVAVARLAVLALPAIEGHGFVDDADGFAARVEPVLLEAVGLSVEDACPECRGSGGPCDYDEFGCKDGWTDDD